ncbi:hypothetical protein HPP92_020929 [Vanilla planifolia]|uniref:START domain-containing protein n=1 Tax=Vanilla planifolia TaxID=51239 RepID=A0A835Q383_VANPL|nr:hypothetical protein HPP92_020929 [Vanilla planifolia]
MLAVTSEDLKHLSDLVEATDDGPAWIQMMDKTMPNMSYKAWRRDPEVPFFCDREYTIGRRIWKVDGAYYCVTKEFHAFFYPGKIKPKRVDLYYSSWRIRAVESLRGDGQMTACEVLLFHYEDMASHGKLQAGCSTRHGGCVKKIEPGLRAYQVTRNSGEFCQAAPQWLRSTSKVDSGYPQVIGDEQKASMTLWRLIRASHGGSNIPKFLIVGGAVAPACSLDHGLLTKAIIFGVGGGLGRLENNCDEEI